jgi:DNA-binding beta-propeller fold protein YncE
MNARSPLRRGLPAQILAGAVLIAFSGVCRPTPAPPPPPSGVIVLDNCDPVFRGKPTYEDNLSFFDASAKLRARVSGLNVCEEIGSPHHIVVDAARKCVWVAENVGHRLLQYDLQGNEILAVPGVKCSSVAVDPETGNVWLTASGTLGQGPTLVFDKFGNSQAVHDFNGCDITYDPKGKAFWLAGRQLLKVSPRGKVLFSADVAGWAAVSVAVNARTGAVWVVTREHSAGTGKNQLLGFDNDGNLLHTVPLKEKIPFRVAVNSRDGSVWVTNLHKSVLHFTDAGVLRAEHALPALAADVEPATGNVWVVTADEVVKIDPKGKELARTPHKAKTSQAWIATY